MPPEPSAVLGSRAAVRSARTIAGAQERNGAIPWYPGGHMDPWDHIEAAMALDVGGFHVQAEDAYGWLRTRQRADGSWAAAYRLGDVQDPRGDSNFCAYVAVGVWHHYRCTGDFAFLRRMWPTVQRAIAFVLGLQRTGGEIRWARDVLGRPWDEAMLTGNASIYQSLRCALAIADECGGSEPDWELAAGQVGHAVAHHGERFSPKHRWSMDWYYPVLAGPVRDGAALHRLTERWEVFVVDGLGIRCVADAPWVTGAETCELAIALANIDRRDDAAGLVEAMQHLRDPDGSYWTGYVWPDDARWPIERTTWTAAAVLLADAALEPVSVTASVFTGSHLPVGVGIDDVPCRAVDPACGPVLDGLR